MHLSCVLAFLSATAITLGAPVANNNAHHEPSTVADAEMAIVSPPIHNDHGFPEIGGIESEPKSEAETLDKRFYYNNYTPLEERGLEGLSRRFYYHAYEPLERRHSHHEAEALGHTKRFYYHAYEPLERRGGAGAEPASETLGERFYYDHYLPLEARGMGSTNKRFYYNHYDPVLERRDEEVSSDM